MQLPCKSDNVCNSRPSVRPYLVGWVEERNLEFLPKILGILDLSVYTLSREGQNIYRKKPAVTASPVGTK